MAYVTAVTIGTSNKVSVDYQSQEVSVSVTFQLERGDTDLQSFVEAQTPEVERAHSTIWRRIRELRAEAKAKEREAADGRTAESQEANGQPAAAAAPVEPLPAERPSRRKRNGRQGSEPPPAADPPPDAPAEPEPATAPVAVAEESPPPFLPAPETAEPMATVAQQRAILTIAQRAGMTDGALAGLLADQFGKRAVEELTKPEAAQLLMAMQRDRR